MATGHGTEQALAARVGQGIETESHILAALRSGRWSTPSEIAEKTGFTRSRVNHALRRMAAKGYIDLRINPHVQVTPKPLAELAEALGIDELASMKKGRKK